MQRYFRALAAIVLGLVVTGCGGPAIEEGPPKGVTGVVNPPGFEDMMKNTGKDMANPKAAGKMAPKEAAKEPAKETGKEAPPEPPK